MSGAAAPAIRWRGLAWAVLPPVGVLLLRAALRAQTDEATASLQALGVAVQVSTPGEAMWAASKPAVLTVVVLGAIGAALYLGLRASIRRHGWARVAPWVQWVWLVLWLLIAAGLLAHHLNRTGRQPQPAQQAEVMLVRELAPSQRHLGGADLYLRAQGEPEPLHLLAEGQPAAAFPPRSQVRLQAERGRWWGRWGRVTPLAPAATPGAGVPDAPGTGAPAVPAAPAPGPGG